MKNILSIVFMALLTFSCAVVKRGPAEEFRNYREELTETRYTFPSLPDPEKLTERSAADKQAGNPVDAQLDEAINYLVRENMSEQFYSGFTILVYSGVDREQAFETRNKLYNTFPNINTNMEYQQPRYLVKVGKYINRIEAQAQYHKIKDEFPNTRIIQDRFERSSTSEENLEDVTNEE